jgi:hypothetical protein
MGYGLGDQGSIPDSGKRFFSPQQRPDRQWSPHSLLSNEYWGLIPPRVKMSGFPADHSPPSSAEVKNGVAISPLPHTSSWRNA